jgi:hypothetical protein
MILETPKFKVTNIIFESYEHRSKIIYNLSYHMSITNGEHFPWLDHAKKILNECAPHIFGTHKLLFLRRYR